jgi:hypothetical protein
MSSLNKVLMTLFSISVVLIASASNIKIINGSFEKGTSGYWVSRAAAVRVDSTDSTDGKQSAVIEPSDGKRVDLVQGIKLVPNVVYQLSFDARSTKPQSGPQLVIETMLQGNRPIRFFYANVEQKKKMTTPAKLTDKWATYTYKVGPFPEKAQNKKVKKIMFYWRFKPGEQSGRVMLDNIKISTVPVTNETEVKKKVAQ